MPRSNPEIRSHVFICTGLQFPASARFRKYVIVPFDLVRVRLRIERHRLREAVTAPDVAAKLDRLATALRVRAGEDPSAKACVTLQQVAIEQLHVRREL